MKWGVIATLVVAGCSEGRAVTVDDVARWRAAVDLRCPTEQVAIYEAVDGSRVGQGCGAWRQYECFERVISVHRGHQHYGPICVREAPTQVQPPPPIPLPRPAPPEPTAAGAGAGYPFN